LLTGFHTGERNKISVTTQVVRFRVQGSLLVDL